MIINTPLFVGWRSKVRLTRTVATQRGDIFAQYWAHWSTIKNLSDQRWKQEEYAWNASRSHSKTPASTQTIIFMINDTKMPKSKTHLDTCSLLMMPIIWNQFQVQWTFEYILNMLTHHRSERINYYLQYYGCSWGILS